MATKLVGDSFAPGSITASQLVVGALNPVLTSVAVCDSSYNVLDDTAANTGGAYIQVTGTNFTTNSVVVIGTTTATSTTYVNNTTLRAQVPAFTAASYPVYVIDTYDGSTAIRVNGITFSNTPIWGTGTTLTSQNTSVAFAISLSANSDSSIIYSNTTSLPSGTSLLANGYFYGTVTVGSDTTYNFTVKANDTENQDASRTFSVTITGPVYGLWSWGNSNSGQAGQNTITNLSSPVQVGALTNWTNKLCIGKAADVALAIKKDGTLWSWGQGQFGVTGTNSTINRSSPTQVGVTTDWSMASTRAYSSVAIKTNGTLWSWGRNVNGELGQNSNNASTGISSPVQVGASTNWAFVSAGHYSNHTVKTDGTLWSWGYNNYGELGTNDIVSRSSPTQIGTDTNWSKVAGGPHTTIAIKTDGTMWSWGRGNIGVLGLNLSSGDKSSPTQIGTDTNWSTVSMSYGGASGTSESALATKTNGTIWTWGYNGTGGLGLNDTVNRSSPTQVGAITTWSNASMGEANCVAVKTDGTIWSWGNNQYGNLGLNTSGAGTYKSSPVQVGAATNWYWAELGWKTLLVLKQQ